MDEATQPFDGLLGRLAQDGQLRDFSRNQIVVREGEASEGIYIVASGQFKVYTTDERTRELVFNTLGPGDLFGEMFLDGGRRSASVKATTADATCIEIPAHAIQGLIRSEPEFAVLLVQSLIGRLRRATELTKALALQGVADRVIDLIRRVAVDDGMVRVVPMEMTQQEIANRIGATREMVNHVIQQFLRNGVLARDAKRRLILPSS